MHDVSLIGRYPPLPTKAADGLFYSSDVVAKALLDKCPSVPQNETVRASSSFLRSINEQSEPEAVSVRSFVVGKAVFIITASFPDAHS